MRPPRGVLRVAARVSALLCVLGLQGCASLVSMVEPSPFGGVQHDWTALSRIKHPVAWLAIVDLPLSLSVDLVCLPVTTGFWLAREEPSPAEGAEAAEPPR